MPYVQTKGLDQSPQPMEQKLGLLYVYEFCERDRKEFERCPNLEQD